MFILLVTTSFVAIYKGTRTLLALANRASLRFANITHFPANSPRILRVKLIFTGRKASMKQNITPSIDEQLLRKAKVFAAQPGTSISGLLAQELQHMIEAQEAYEQSEKKAISLLDQRFSLGGQKITDRSMLHDRLSQPFR